MNFLFHTLFLVKSNLLTEKFNAAEEKKNQKENAPIWKTLSFQINSTPSPLNKSSPAWKIFH